MSFFDIFRKKSEDNITSHQLMEMMLSSGEGIEKSVPLNRAAKIASVYSCIRIISESIGVMPLRLYRKEDDARYPVSKSDKKLYDLQRIISVKPNSFMTAPEFWEHAGAVLAAYGVFYAYKNRYKGEIRELIPLSYDSVYAELGDNNKYSYKISHKNGSQIELKHDDIFRVQLFSRDPAKPTSPIAENAATMNMALGSQRIAGGIIRNGGRPSGVLSTAAPMKEEQTDLIRKNWELLHSGDNSGKVAILTGGLSYQPIQLSPADLQYI